MKPQIVYQDVTNNLHTWTVCINVCDVDDPDDATIDHMVKAVRNAYGEEEILEIIESLDPDPSVSESFDVASIVMGFRMGLPHPGDEGKKPEQLTTYRSETCEFFARETLNLIHDIETPGTLHACKGNALQPLLGYDGWGIQKDQAGNAVLVLIQVKGSDDSASPPQAANALALECVSISSELNKLSRALSACLLRVKHTKFADPLVRMLEKLGKNQTLNLIVAPVVVRGHVKAQISDLAPVLNSHKLFGSVTTCAMAVTIGAPLGQFGRIVMLKARQS